MNKYSSIKKFKVGESVGMLAFGSYKKFWIVSVGEDYVEFKYDNTEKYGEKTFSLTIEEINELIDN